MKLQDEWMGSLPYGVRWTYRGCQQATTEPDSVALLLV